MLQFSLLLVASWLCGEAFPDEESSTVAEPAYFVTADSLEDSSKVTSPEGANEQKPLSVRDDLTPDTLINDTFPIEEFESRMPPRLAQPGGARWWLPSEAPQGSWQTRDQRDEELTSWFASLELALVKPHVVSNENSGTLLSPTFADPLQLPASPLGISVMPVFKLGRISPTAGTGFQLQYRFLLSSGAYGTSLPGVEANNQLQFHVVDLDFLYRTHDDDPIGDHWGLSTINTGIRFASIGNRFALQPWSPGEQAATNSDIGAGPHFGVNREFLLGASGWTMVLQGDGAGLVVNDHQSFARHEFNPLGGGPISAAGSQTNTTGIATACVKGMFQYQRDWRGRPWKLQAGYRWERWWFLGTDSSNLELTIQGPFLLSDVHF